MNHTSQYKIAPTKIFQGERQGPTEAHSNPFSFTLVRGRGFPEKTAMSWYTGAEPSVPQCSN